MAGIQDFTHIFYGKETVRGIPVAPTRVFYGQGTGVLQEDLSLDFHENENRQRKSVVARVTQVAEDTTLAVASHSGIGYDDLVWPITQLKGGLTGTGAGADKTWTGAPSMTAANNQEAFSLDVGDDVQNWRIQYGMMQSWKLSAAIGQLTSFEAALFGQRAVKTAQAAPANTSPVNIPGDLWTAKFAATFAGLTGASIQTNLMREFELEVITGLKWRHYQDGNLFGAQHVETSMDATLKLTVESTAFTISEMYDKWKAQTQDYIRLKATGPSLGASNYSIQFDLPILWSNVPQIGAEDEGVNLYEVEARVNDDGTNFIAPTLVCSLAAIP